jgi:hypothetical protein
MGIYSLQIPFEWVEYADELLLKLDDGMGKMWVIL